MDDFPKLQITHAIINSLVREILSVGSYQISIRMLKSMVTEVDLV